MTKTQRIDPAFRVRDSIHTNSKSAYIDMLQNNKRLIADVEFPTLSNVWSTTSFCNLSGLSLTATAGSPVHIRTIENPQYTFIIPIAGNSRLVEGSRLYDLSGHRVIRCSHNNPVLLDLDDYSLCGIRPNIDHLIDVMKIEERDRDYVRNRLFDMPTEDVTEASLRIRYYEIFRMFLRLIDTTEGDADQLNRFRIEALIMKLIAELTLTLDPTLLKLTDPQYTRHLIV